MCWNRFFNFKRKTNKYYSLNRCYCLTFVTALRDEQFTKKTFTHRIIQKEGEKPCETKTRKRVQWLKIEFTHGFIIFVYHWLKGSHTHHEKSYNQQVLAVYAVVLFIWVRKNGILQILQIIIEDEFNK